MPSFVIDTVLRAILVLAVSAIVLLSPSVTASAQEAGKAAYIDTGCARCHSVATEGIEATASERMRGRDLGTLGTEAGRDAGWVIAVVKQDEELDDGPHRARFRGSDEQLTALAEWLVDLE